MRAKQLIKCIPDIYETKSIMYVGGHVQNNRCLQMIDGFIERRYEIDVLEIFPPNVKDLKNIGWIRNVYQGNVLDYKFPQKYDVIMFWHGIEHILKFELSNLIEHLKKYANHLIVFACPWGIYYQGKEYGNLWEKHVSHWYPEELKNHGLNIDTLGAADSLESNLLSWLKIC